MKKADYGQLVEIKDGLEKLIFSLQLRQEQVQFDFDPMICL